MMTKNYDENIIDQSRIIIPENENVTLKFGGRSTMMEQRTGTKKAFSRNRMSLKDYNEMSKSYDFSSKTREMFLKVEINKSADFDSALL